MPLKTKTPPLNQTSQQPPSLSEERILRVNPEIDRRLDGFMTANDKMTEYYTKLVKENPERAVRAFMLGKMFKHEAQLRVTERQAPQAKEWLDQQEPGIKQRIMDRLFRERRHDGVSVLVGVHAIVGQLSLHRAP